MGSQRFATSAMEAAALPPSSANLTFLAGSTSNPITSKPAPSRRCASAWPNRPTPMSPTGLRSVIYRSLAQRRDAEITRGGLEAAAQRLGHGNAILDALLPLEMTLLAGQPDALDPGQPLGAAHGADRGVHVALEVCHRHEAFDRDGDDGVAGVGRFARLLDEIDHVAPESGAVERAGEEPDDQAQARTLIVADREQEAFVGALGIGERLAVAAAHSADRQLLPPPRPAPPPAQ